MHWQDDGVPASARFGDVYRSPGEDGLGGLAQARHVFLAGCELLPVDGQRAAWANAPSWQMLATGFGLGLNFLAAWQAWRDDPARPQRLLYSAIEAWPPSADDLRRSAAPYPALAPLAEQLAARWHGLLPGFHRLAFENGRLQLTLCVGDVQAMLAELSGRYDSVLLDGFNPACNPDMWSLPTLQAVTRQLRPGARLATWCVAGELRERLTQCGFEVQRVPGLPPKRHALRAVYQPRWTPRAARHAVVAAVTTPGQCAIVGGGLAGASLACSLAARGWQVTVLDRASDSATGASGLPAGVVAPHVSPDDRPLSRLTRAGAAATLARARQLLAEGIDWAPSGVLERHGPGERRRPAAWSDADAPEASRPASVPASPAQAAAAQLPLDDAQPALWHGHAGWLRPAALVRAMLGTPGVTWRGGQRVARLVRRPHSAPECSEQDSNPASIDADSDPIWQLIDDAGAVLARADLVVLAAGYDTLALLQASDAHAVPPLHALRGQLAFGRQAPHADLPPFPVNGHGSLIANLPAADGGLPLWVAGSTFERGRTEAVCTDANHAANRQRLLDLLPAAGALLAPQFDDGRAERWAAVRCTIPDRLPLIGPWPGLGGLSAPCPTGQAVAPAATSDAPQPGTRLRSANAHPWLFTGLGARGLTLAVLAGEISAAWLHDEPLPIERTLAASLRADRWLRPSPVR